MHTRPTRAASTRMPVSSQKSSESTELDSWLRTTQSTEANRQHRPQNDDSRGKLGLEEDGVGQQYATRGSATPAGAGEGLPPSGLPRGPASRAPRREGRGASCAAGEDALLVEDGEVGVGGEHALGQVLEVEVLGVRLEDATALVVDDLLADRVRLLLPSRAARVSR